MFSQACVILFTGGVSASVHAGITPTPQSRHPPPEQTPLEQTHIPGSRHPLEQTPLGVDTPLREQTPPSRHPLGADTPQSRHPSPYEQTPPLGADTPPPPQEQTPPGPEHAGRYGQHASGTHATGMQLVIIGLRIWIHRSKSCLYAMTLDFH